eukprot:2804714-Amphidinium_carterae.1
MRLVRMVTGIEDSAVAMPVGIIRDGSTSSLSSVGSLSDLHLAGTLRGGEVVFMLQYPCVVGCLRDCKRAEHSVYAACPARECAHDILLAPAPASSQT